MSNVATKVDDQVTFKPGFSLFANLDLPVLNNTLLVNMIVMKTDTGADDTSKGTESLLAGADGTLKGTEKGPESKNTSATALECTVALANTNGSVTPDPLDLVFTFK